MKVVHQIRIAAGALLDNRALVRAQACLAAVLPATFAHQVRQTLMTMNAPRALIRKRRI
jgi:hypothetical protein